VRPSEIALLFLLEDPRTLKFDRFRRITLELQGLLVLSDPALLSKAVRKPQNFSKI